MTATAERAKLRKKRGIKHEHKKGFALPVAYYPRVSRLLVVPFFSRKENLKRNRENSRKGGVNKKSGGSREKRSSHWFFSPKNFAMVLFPRHASCVPPGQLCSLFFLPPFVLAGNRYSCGAETPRAAIDPNLLSRKDKSSSDHRNQPTRRVTVLIALPASTKQTNLEPQAATTHEREAVAATRPPPPPPIPPAVLSFIGGEARE